MKKIVLSLAGVLAATAFAPEAAAVPSFARQTGMACNSCHFNTYPALTSFGRAFKSGGYTMIGAQAKVEGDHGLSIPATLNASIYTQLRYNKTNGNHKLPTSTSGNKNSGRFDMPDEMALFLAGRVSENIGFMTEMATGQAGTSVANFKMPFVWDVGTVKLSAIPFWTNSLGPAAAFDLFATGSNAAGRITENGQGYSAAMYMGSTNNPTGGSTLNSAASAQGLALVVSNENFHVDLTPYTSQPFAVNSTARFGATYFRAAWTPNYNNWDLGIGLQNWSGKSNRGQATNDKEVRLTIIDAQAQGEVSGMPLGVYASYGTAPSTNALNLANVTGAGVNDFNMGPDRKSAFGIMGDLWVLPGTLGLQLGLMRARTGMRNAITLSNESDNSYTLGARYKIRQNVKVGVAMTKFSGDAYDAGGSGGTNADDTSNIIRTPQYAVGVPSNAQARRGDRRLTLILSAGF